MLYIEFHSLKLTNLMVIRVKKVLLVTALLASSSTMAANKSTWELNENQDLVIKASVVERTTGSNTAVIYLDQSAGLTPGFIGFDPNCAEYTKPFPIENSTINGKKVSMSNQCLGEGIGMKFPATAKGQAYLLNAYYKGKNVLVDDYEYSAMGFRKVVTHLIERYEGI